MTGRYALWLVSGVMIGADWLRRSVAAALDMRSLTDITIPEWDRLPDVNGEQPSVTVVVPARNEEAEIERCLRSLVAQDYPNLDICAIDDRSTDKTGSIMDRLCCEAQAHSSSVATEGNRRQRNSDGKLRVLHIAELPAGWLGKTHAMWEGAQTSKSDWILFTDGDVVFRPDALRRALAYAEAERLDHLVLFPTAIMKTVGERMMMAFFGVSFSLVVRVRKIKDPKSRDFVGAGAFNLIRRSAYEGLGTYHALRMEVIDDLMLGQAVKQNGFRSYCALGPQLVKLRWAVGAFGVARNLRKNMFSLLNFSWPLAALVSIAATVYHVGPWAGFLFAPGFTKVGFGIALLAIALMYFGMWPLFKISPGYLFTQPVAALMFVYTLLASAASSVIHGGVHWRGTTYSLAEIQAAKAQSRRGGLR